MTNSVPPQRVSPNLKAVLIWTSVILGLIVVAVVLIVLNQAVTFVDSSGG